MTLMKKMSCMREHLLSQMSTRTGIQVYDKCPSDKESQGKKNYVLHLSLV